MDTNLITTIENILTKKKIKLKITSAEENKKLLFWTKTPIKNHSKKTTGRIFTKIQ